LYYREPVDSGTTSARGATSAWLEDSRGELFHHKAIAEAFYISYNIKSLFYERRAYMKIPMVQPLSLAVFFNFFVILSLAPCTSWSQTNLPKEPEEGTHLEEIYDQETAMVMFLYSLEGTEKFDYVVGRKVRDHQRSAYGNPVYYLEPFPLFYWWNHTMWNDPEQDGVNGNELVYQEEVDFDVSRYKPCLFNGQPC